MGERLELHLEAEPGELGDQTPGFRFGRAAIEVVGAEILMRRAVAQHVVDGGKNGGGDGADRLLRAAPAFQPMELGRVVAVLLAFGSPRALHQHGLQPGRAFAQARGLTLAGIFVLAWAQSGPGNQVPGGREAAHVATDLGEDRRRREDTDTGDRAQQ